MSKTVAHNKGQFPVLREVLPGIHVNERLACGYLKLKPNSILCKNKVLLHHICDTEFSKNATALREGYALFWWDLSKVVHHFGKLLHCDVLYI